MGEVRDSQLRVRTSPFFFKSRGLRIVCTVGCTLRLYRRFAGPQVQGGGILPACPYTSSIKHVTYLLQKTSDVSGRLSTVYTTFPTHTPLDCRDSTYGTFTPPERGDSRSEKKRPLTPKTMDGTQILSSFVRPLEVRMLSRVTGH